MVFPFDVNKTVTDSNKVAGDSKIQGIITLFVLGSLAALFAINYVLSTIMKLPFMVTVVVYLILFITVGILVFRFCIFNEDEKKKEFESAEGDSFARYLWLRSDNGTNTKIDVGNEKINIFEFVDGSQMCILELRFGSNDDNKAATTQWLNERMIAIANENGLESRVIDVPENFKNSKEFREHREAINNIKDPKLAKNVMVIDEAIMETSAKECNVDVIYFMMRTMSNYQRMDLEVALKKIFRMMKQNVSAYRSVHFLNSQELMEFYREFYHIAAIDLSMMKTVELAQQLVDNYTDLVSVMYLKTSSGKVFETKECEYLMNKTKVLSNK